MGKDKKQKVEAPPPPPPVRTFEVTGANELHVATVLAATRLMASSYSAATSIACYPPKGEALQSYLSSAGLKKAPNVMLVENGIVCVGLRACLSALAVSKGSHIFNAEVQQWLSFVEDTLSPAVVKKVRLDEERSDSKSIIPHIYITSKLPLVASLRSSPRPSSQPLSRFASLIAAP